MAGRFDGLVGVEKEAERVEHVLTGSWHFAVHSCLNWPPVMTLWRVQWYNEDKMHFRIWGWISDN